MFDDLPRKYRPNYEKTKVKKKPVVVVTNPTRLVDKLYNLLRSLPFGKGSRRIG